MLAAVSVCLRAVQKFLARTGAPLVCAFLLAPLVLGSSEFAAAQVPSASAAEIASSLTQLLASNAEWQRNDHDFRTQREQGRLSDVEAAEFAEFVAGLRHRVLVDCGRLRDLGGEPLEHAIDCGEADSGAGASVAIAVPAAVGAALTEDEKTAVLDNELRSIEAELDELLAARENEINAARRSPASSVSASGNRSAGRRDGGQKGGVNNGDRGAASGSEGQRGDRVNTAGVEASAGTGGSGSGGSTAGLGNGQRGTLRTAQRGSGRWDGADDDTLARQLREAAESEPDPVLKDKLWEEYRKYKASIR